RRGPTRNPVIQGTSGRPYLMDYCAAVPGPVRSQWKGPGPYDTAILNWSASAEDYVGCGREHFWGAPGEPIHSDSPNNTKDKLGSSYYGFWGVIVRGNLWIYGSTQTITGFYSRITP